MSKRVWGMVQPGEYTHKGEELSIPNYTYGHRMDTWARVIKTWRIECRCTFSRISELAPLVWTPMQIAAMLKYAPDKVHVLGTRLCSFAMEKLGETWTGEKEKP